MSAFQFFPGTPPELLPVDSTPLEQLFGVGLSSLVTLQNIIWSGLAISVFQFERSVFHLESEWL